MAIELITTKATREQIEQMILDPQLCAQVWDITKRIMDVE